jgi:hypothetical protein
MTKIELVDMCRSLVLMGRPPATATCEGITQTGISRLYPAQKQQYKHNDEHNA